ARACRPGVPEHSSVRRVAHLRVPDRPRAAGLDRLGQGCRNPSWAFARVEAGCRCDRPPEETDRVWGAGRAAGSAAGGSARSRARDPTAPGDPVGAGPDVVRAIDARAVADDRATGRAPR